MEGPYRDLGAGFARLLGPEGARRSPSRISTVEDALLELLRNARDAGAHNIYVSTTLLKRRYRTLTVLDDGYGIPESHAALIFEPGVTTRHLDPILQLNDSMPHGAGLSLYHIRNASVKAEVASARNPTSITATFDTQEVSERSLQSGSRNSKTNLAATLLKFLENTPDIHLYHGSPARILATIIKNRIIHPNTTDEARALGMMLGLEVSLRTTQRVFRGELGPVKRMEAAVGRERGGAGSGSYKEGVVVSLGQDETAELEAILSRIVRARYLEIGSLRVESRPGEISLRVQVYELEDEYE